MSTVIQIYKHTPDGDGSDVLVFLTGQDEIDDLASLLKRYLEDLEPDDGDDSNNKNTAKNGDVVQNIKGIGTSLDSGNSLIVNGVLICVLYASLPPEQQMLAFRPKPEGISRKVIISTNIAGEKSMNLDEMNKQLKISQLVLSFLPCLQKQVSHSMVLDTLLTVESTSLESINHLLEWKA